MNRFSLVQGEVAEITALLNTITRCHRSSEEPEFLKEATVYAQDLPRRLRSFLNDFKLLEASPGLCIISGYPIHEEKIGNTPEHWKSRQEPSPVLEEEILLVLCGSLLGDVIGWATQQDGHIVHDVFPVKGHEHEQLGIGSEELLWWHTEDAFHPYRGDYLGLMCLRNPDRVATTVGSIDKVQLDDPLLDRLFSPSFIIHPDESHLLKNNTNADSLLKSAFDRIEKMNEVPERIPVLFGDRTHPYIRIDPYFMDEVGNEEADRALKVLVQSIDKIMEDLVLESGDILLIDNFRTVHGRKPFKARYDGRDRWLKRINITRDLRKSRDTRSTPEARVIA